MALRVGSVVSGYRIEKVLGAGGMGTVYLAANPVLPRRDALKVLSFELSHDPSFRARFIREADLAATLDHPNIVTVYNRGETDDGQLWIAMQYVAGSDAHRELDQGRMTARRAVYIVGEVAKALDYAHRRNLIHRDVKPANFLLGADDERVLLADFGIARALDDSVGLTATGTMMGTVAYAAPEILSAGPVDGRADVYALGCSLYRMLSGRTPFATTGGSMAAVMAAHLSAPPPRVSDHAAVPQAMDAVIAKAMAKEPDQRYQTAAELAGAAGAALQGEVVGQAGMTAPSARSPYRVPSPHPGAQPPAHDVMTYPSGYFSGPRPVPQLPPQAPVPKGPQSFGLPPQERGAVRPPRRRRWIAAAIAAVVFAGAATVAAVLWTGRESGFQPQSFSHAHGTTQVNAQPHAVAAIGPGDGDAVMSLGVQPIAMTAPGGHLASWEAQLATGNPKVLSTVDAAAIGAAKPDVVIATGDIDDATYKTLAGIAPTITRPANQTGPGWAWQDQLSWIARILGREDQGKQLVSAARDQQNALRDKHLAFNGKSVAVLNVSDSGVTGTLMPSNAGNYLEGLGFRYLDQLKRTGTDTGDVRPVTDADFTQIEQTEVLVVVRTDKAAGGGGYNGLPKPLTAYGGAMAIVDNADTTAALNTGGYAATDFLNKTFVDNLAQQVH